MRPSLPSALVFLITLSTFPVTATAATFVVDSTGDGSDADVGDNVCATAGGDCTLRAAIEQSNELGGRDTIEFDISGTGPHTIQPASTLPSVTDPLYIKGDSEPDYNDSPVVVLDGQNAGTAVDGLTYDNVTGDNSLVQGLSIVNFDRDGIVLDGTDSALIYNNYIGVNADASEAGNGGNGITLANGASSNTIGLGSGTSNVISGNSRRGIFFGIAATEDGNQIKGNLIGVDPSGTQDMGNFYEGIVVNGATNTEIGGSNSAAGAGNTISGNGRSGILIIGGDTTIRGNHIGTNDAGDAVIANDGNGIDVDSGALATIGGTASGAGNIVAGNASYEIRLGTDGNAVQGNYIDTNSNGDDLGSSFNALRIAGNNNQIGGTTSSARNVIGHTRTNAIDVDGTNNTLHGNYVGVMPDGTPIPHAGTSIRIFESNNTIGGIGPGEGNTLANAGWGVAILFGTGHTIRGNAIYNQSQLGIDINRDGKTANDSDDSDDGTNRLQNFPEIQDADYDSGTNEITVVYQVPSDPSLSGSGASAYDLSIDFYRSDSDGSGEAYLGTDTYTATDYNSGPTKQVTFSPAGSFSNTDTIVTTATDANGNTSEFSLLDNIFADRFEQ